MKIDGTDVAEYGVRQWALERGIAELKNESEWTAGAPTPTMLKSTVGFKKMKVGIIIRGSTRAEIWQKSSDFIARLLEPHEYQFDGFGHYFYGYIKNADQAETSLQRWHKATIELEGYEYGDEVTIESTEKSIIVNNVGNMLTPAVVEVTPLINLVSLSLTGLVRNTHTGEEKAIVIGNLTNGRTIKIDGETGLITENGANKFADANLWDLPTLKPGANTITVDKDVRIKIRHKPRYL